MLYWLDTVRLWTKELYTNTVKHCATADNSVSGLGRHTTQHNVAFAMVPTTEKGH